MNIKEKLQALRQLMSERGIDAYFIPTADFHETEYVGEHFKARAYMSGFTGSQATLIVGQKEAALWTDGRYFIQAEEQLQGSTITLMKQGEEGVLTVEEYLAKHLQENGCLGFDGRVMNTALAMKLQQVLADKHVRFACDEDLVGLLWKDRPPLPKEKGFFLEEAYSGRSTADKLSDVRKAMAAVQADCHIVTTLDDIAWMLNMRGWDIACYPVMLSYLVLTEDNGHLFVDADKLDDALRHNLSANHIQLHPYDAIYDFVKQLDAKAILLNRQVVNYAITANLQQDIQIIDQPNPSQMLKAVKNPIEQENNRIAHIHDGVAVTKFMYWLKTTIGKERISEISASEHLLALRKQQLHFLEPSFETIAAYGPHAAMMHYSATPESDVELRPEGMLLVDSGGQYLEGTTDITRTFVLGPISDEVRLHFTTALRSHINLSRAHFLYGCRGLNLDILARGPLWDMGIDYKCGTGHGVGHLLNVHEGPNGFRWRIVPERNDSCVLEEGMTQSNEPGVYVEGSHGIRHENEMVVHKGEKNEYGQFMYFETITFVPFDLDGIDVSLLTDYDIEWLNWYHQQVYEKISPYLQEDEKAWLQQATRAIHR